MFLGVGGVAKRLNGEEGMWSEGEGMAYDICRHGLH